MKKRILRYLKHLFATLIILLIIGIITILSLNGNAHYGESPIKKNWQNEGPYIFFDNDSTFSIHHISGNKEDGIKTTQYHQPIRSSEKVQSYFNLDSSHFEFTISPDIEIPRSTYNDEEKIIAISDIESGYKTFRDFLINNKVLNKDLEWIFGKGHLVLNGDFVDRGFSTTQVLWLIYKMEKEAKQFGGNVHFILGNHEIKNLQGNYTKAASKYFYVATVLNKQQYELYDQQSLMGKWMASKNTVELINGHLFVHGGIHPDLANFDTNINEINTIVRNNYRQAYYPKNENNLEQFLISTTKGPSWYRGYFKEDLSNEEIEKGLRLFDAKAIIVGHTIQRKVKKMHDGKVFCIDINHPKDYRKSWPSKQSEGLLIEDDTYYRLLHNGKKIKL